MFKRVNDLAKVSNFEKEWDLQEFTRFFLAQDMFSKSQPPSLYDFVMIFEMLDENHTGMISAKNLRNFLELSERLRIAKFD